jgi:hypothetical protein
MTAAVLNGVGSVQVGGECHGQARTGRRPAEALLCLEERTPATTSGDEVVACDLTRTFLRCPQIGGISKALRHHGMPIVVAWRGHSIQRNYLRRWSHAGTRVGASCVFVCRHVRDNSSARTSNTGLPSQSGTEQRHRVLRVHRSTVAPRESRFSKMENTRRHRDYNVRRDSTLGHANYIPGLALRRSSLLKRRVLLQRTIMSICSSAEKLLAASDGDIAG